MAAMSVFVRTGSWLVGAGLVGLLLGPLLWPHGTADAASIVVRVADQPRQTFEAFGWSIPRRNDPFTAGLVDEVGRDAFNKVLYTDLGTNVVRLWYGFEGADDFARRLVETGALADARAHGVEILLLAPTAHAMELARTHPEWLDGEELVEIGAFVEHLADLIATLRDRYGIVIDATGMINEPGADDRIVIEPRDYGRMVLMQREALDRRGLADVRLIGFEFCCPGDTSRTYYETIAADADAKAALAGLATHSYSAAIPPDHADLALRNDWQYWQTEAGGARSPADIAARFLNDLNNAATHWIFFIGPTKALSFHALAEARRTIGVADHYHALQLIARSFVKGTVMRHASSSLEGEMPYRTGAKGVLYAAAGLRPDERWVVGLANPTGGPNDRWFRFGRAQDHEVTVEIAELASVRETAFAVCSSAGRVPVCDRTVTFANGIGTLPVPAGETVTLMEIERS